MTTHTLDHTLDPSTLQHWTLPREAYVSPRLYEEEQRQIFQRGWAFVCHVSEVASPGAYVTQRIGGEPVVVLRDQDGTLRAFSNVCRHRASVLLEGRGTLTKVITCPYHGWSYKLNGKLQGVAEAKSAPTLERSSLGLPSLSVDVLSGFVFVSLEENPPPLDTFFGDLSRKLAAHRLEELQFDHLSWVDYNQNWKVVVDNFLEGYHVAMGHPGLARLFDYPGYQNHPGERHVWIDAPLSPKPSKDPLERLYQRLTTARPGLHRSMNRSWWYTWIWPSTCLNLYPEQADIWHLIPLGINKTRAVSIVYLHPHAGLRHRLASRVNWHINTLVSQEDDEICTRVQEGLGSRLYQRGRLHDKTENAVQHFHALLRRNLPDLDPEYRLSV
ncbi:MAG: aromatic ring-hydroxylating oxygenase subunit alpha [Myxococcota bacterium]